MVKRFGRMLWKYFQSLKPGQVLAFGFFSVILLGALLLVMPIATVDRHSIGFLDALFTSTSAVCVTGLVVLNTGVVFSLFGQIVIVCLIQIGGLGFMTVASLLFMAIGRRFSLKDRLLIQESFNSNSLQGLVKLVRSALLVTFVTEGVAAVILAIRFIPLYGICKGLFFAVFLAVSAFCNAGFDPFGFFNSIEPMAADWTVCLTLMALITIGGMGFAVVLDVLHTRHFRKLMLHTRVVLVMSGVLFLVGWLLFAVLEWNNPQTLAQPRFNAAEKLLNAAFQSVTVRTAGFDTIGQNGLTPAGHLLTIILMFIGASPASTGGGIKTTTFFLVLLSMAVMVRNRQDYNVFDRRVNDQLVKRALAIFSMALGLVLVNTFLISMVETTFNGGKPLDDVLYEVTSAFGTVGLTAGLTPALHALSKILLIITMFVGRLGPMTLSMALAGEPRHAEAVRYPEDRLMVG